MYKMKNCLYSLLMVHREVASQDDVGSWSEQLEAQIRELMQASVELPTTTPWQFAREIGLFPSSSVDTPSEEMVAAARSFNHHPSRVSKIEFLINQITVGGIQSSQARKSEQYQLFDVVKGHEDKIHLTFGVPYIGLQTRKDGDPNARIGKRNTLVVFSDSLLDRQDLQTTPIDVGVIYSRYSPLSKYIETINQEHPEWRNTSQDPTLTLFQMLVNKPEYLVWFQRSMQEFVRSLNISRDELELFTALCVQYNFAQPSSIPLRRRCLHMPNGSVTGLIPLSQWKAIIVHHEEYELLYESFPELRPLLVNASSQREEASQPGNDIDLLRAYGKMTGTSSVLHNYITALAHD